MTNKELLRHYMKQKKVTEKDIAAVLGMSLWRTKQRTHAKADFTVTEIEKIVALLEIPDAVCPAVFFDGEDNPQRK